MAQSLVELLTTTREHLQELGRRVALRGTARLLIVQRDEYVAIRAPGGVPRRGFG